MTDLIISDDSPDHGSSGDSKTFGAPSSDDSKGGGNGNGNGKDEQRLDSSESRSQNDTLEKTVTEAGTIRTIGKLKLRGKTDDLPQDWWFASTAIPLLAATIGPLANVLSIAALVSKWRVTLPNNGQLPEGSDINGIDIRDPHWEIVLNAISLAFGFFGNFCLLLNFTKRIRYIISLPATIISWYIATAILIAITVAMNQHVPPVRPGETYSQGFWHAVIAATLYLVGSMLLMVNMLGYFLGHYPQHFELDDDQRTLILQTMMFFFWLAGGAAVFAKVEGLSYADALYFCDVTVLTIGFGDVLVTNDVGRGLIFPYSVFGIIFLGLMIKSIGKFASSMSKDKVIKKHQLDERERTFGRSVTSEKELRDRLGLPPRRESEGRRQSIIRKQSISSPIAGRRSLEQYGDLEIHGRTVTFHEHRKTTRSGRGGAGQAYLPKVARSREEKMRLKQEGKSPHKRRYERRQKLILLKEEKDRFDAMREIQSHTSRFKQYFALCMSIIAFSLLWAGGAAVFWCTEARIQDLSYFQALYFCYVSLLTIGYGDLSPRSNAGKPFFVIWSVVAIPTMTILVSELGDTLIAAINRGTFTLADWTIMPKEGVWADFLTDHPRIKNWLERKTEERAQKKRLAHGFDLANPDEEAPVEQEKTDDPPKTTLEKLAEEPAEVTEHDLARKLALAIKRTANDLRAERPKKYSYEEWVHFTQLIRFSKCDSAEEVEQEEIDEGLIEWDWIGEDSPMLADVSESEWILDRLCESLNRYTRKQARETRKRNAERATESSALYHSSYQSPLHHHHNNDSIFSYPAHPGPRHPYSNDNHNTTTSGSSSPVLERGPSGDQMVKILHHEKNKSEIMDRGGGGGGSGAGEESTSTYTSSAAVSPGAAEEKKGFFDHVMEGKRHEEGHSKVVEDGDDGRGDVKGV